jgi:hypothetical protein
MKRSSSMRRRERGKRLMPEDGHGRLAEHLERSFKISQAHGSS